MAHLEIRLLGPFQATWDGEPIRNFESDKVRALLAFLAVEVEGAHRREKLAGLLWPEWPERAARANLRHALANLRKAISDRQATPPFLHISRQTIQFNRGSDAWVDVMAFTCILDANGSRQQNIARLEKAIKTYRESFLEGFSLGDSAVFEEWLLLKREQLGRHAMSICDRLAIHFERCGDYKRALQYARRQVELDPWREQAHRQMMRLLMLNGQRGAALAQYEVCRYTLMEELAVEPEKETTILYEQIKAEKIVRGFSHSFVLPNNLPSLLTPFVGREKQVEQIKTYLKDSDCRLLSLVGSGGSGKTYLALKAAAELTSQVQVDDFADGVYFVPLAPVQSVDCIVPTTAKAIGFSFYEGRQPQQQLFDYLRQKRMLLVMDNLEHLLDGVSIVTEILTIAPCVKILSTSRARLNVQGEQLFLVTGMDYPDEDIFDNKHSPQSITHYSAVKLFLTSASRIQPGFELTADIVADVARICRLVEGMPLGILLAAAWTGMLSPAEIAAEIGRGLDFLETEWQDIPTRQRSMRAVFDHSWRLLTEREQRVLQGVSVFSGGFTRESAQAVVGASLHELRALVSKSLLHYDGAGRYEMHELLRRYAEERLDASPTDSDAIRNRHNAYYTVASQKWEKELKGPRQYVAILEMGAEIENARTAWDWAAERRQIERLDQALEGLCEFYSWHYRFQEGEAACRLAIENLMMIESVDGLRLQARILSRQSNYARNLGQIELAKQMAEQSWTLLERVESTGQDTRLEKALVLAEKAKIAFMTDRQTAQKLSEKSLELFRALGNQRATASVLSFLRWIAEDLGMYGKAEQLGHESLSIRRELGDRVGVASSLSGLGFIALRQGRFEEGERLMQESTTIGQQMHGMVYATGLVNLGRSCLLLGKFGEAHSSLKQAVDFLNDLGHHRAVAESYVSVGEAKLHLGQYEEAHNLVQMNLSCLQEFGSWREIGLAHLVLGQVALAEGRYNEALELLQESVEIYRRVGQQDEMGTALALLGFAGHRLGHIHLAEVSLRETLQAASEIGMYVPLVYALPVTGMVLSDCGEFERAIELYALVSRYPYVANSCWFEDVVGQHVATIAATIPPEVIATAQERGRARDLEATAMVLLAEIKE